MQLWLSLFSANTEEELEMIESLEVPEMNEAISAYRRITVTPEFKEIERLRSRARHEEAQALHDKAASIARNMLKRNRPIDEIAEDTGLTREEVEGLQCNGQ
ncbi:MAG: hypothetical protein FWF85_08770 [Clostridiales bacterium]|nr:hypothetical protein [Clostridiales bacterium]